MAESDGHLKHGDDGHLMFGSSGHLSHTCPDGAPESCPPGLSTSYTITGTLEVWYFFSGGPGWTKLDESGFAAVVTSPEPVVCFWEGTWVFEDQLDITGGDEGLPLTPQDNEYQFQLSFDSGVPWSILMIGAGSTDSASKTVGATPTGAYASPDDIPHAGTSSYGYVLRDVAVA